MLKYILTLVFLFFISAGLCQSQSANTATDTLRISNQNTGSEKEAQEQEQVQTGNRNRNRSQSQETTGAREQGENAGNVKAQGNRPDEIGPRKVKQVKGARPDMSKARGARPNIVRPSGSGIPRGVGKPGGA
ncbi:MAG TPA: hypothetical protein PL003_07690, partial [Bacteroidales bacterium]|nr:hypothetical protein [Bacteroidales bacterium]